MKRIIKLSLLFFILALFISCTIPPPVDSIIKEIIINDDNEIVEENPVEYLSFDEVSQPYLDLYGIPEATIDWYEALDFYYIEWYWYSKGYMVSFVQTTSNNFTWSVYHNSEWVTFEDILQTYLNQYGEPDWKFERNWVWKYGVDNKFFVVHFQQFNSDWIGIESYETLQVIFTINWFDERRLGDNRIQIWCTVKNVGSISVAPFYVSFTFELSDGNELNLSRGEIHFSSPIYIDSERMQSIIRAYDDANSTKEIINVYVSGYELEPYYN